MPPDIVDLTTTRCPNGPRRRKGRSASAANGARCTRFSSRIRLVEAITGWDFADGAWLGAPSGLVRADNTPKPSYYELQHMVREEWTSRGTLHTDENGVAELEGFAANTAWRPGAAKGSCRLQKNAGAEPVPVALA